MDREEQEGKVASLISVLGKIDAPRGFEQRVMGRIFERRSGTDHHHSAFLLFLKFAAPAAAVLLIGAMFVFFGDREVNITSVPPVHDAPVAAAKSDNVQFANGAATSPTGQPGSPSGTNVLRRSKENEPSRSGVTSEDLAVEGPGETYMPPGLDPRPRNVDPSAVSPGAGVRVGDVLSFLGANAACGEDGCRVASLSKGSLAERAKLSVGDRIVSIDDRPINGSTAFSGPTAFKTFQVVRGGRTLNLSLSSN